MGIPQVPGQVRRAPLVALRAVFAGFGRVLMVADRPASVVLAAEPASRFRSLDQTGNVRLLPAQETEPGQERPAREAARATEAPSALEPTVGTKASAAPADQMTEAAGLPLPNYDALSLASIRARLRGLDVAQLKVLLDYEAAHTERAEVLGMFERRIEKLEAGQ